uniref:Uncharacterized protein n=1 Tax=Ananas comosus var. bracteatus TaxID=296719 RepID=A0A6V7PZS9_ANACO|nr:unnamed protein product [Ananas comosus var. bracteatus]
MAGDNAMNLRNRVILRNSGNDQANNTERTNERHVVLPVEGETSGQSDQQEPSLAQALEQMTRVLQVLDQNSHKSTARLDAVLAPNTSDETEDSADKVEVYVAEMVKNRQPYKCALLKSAKASEAKARVAAYTYSFDVSKTDLIFDRVIATKLAKMECQKSRTKASEKLRQNEPTKEVGYCIKSADSADEIACIKTAKLVEKDLLSKSAIKADEKVFNEASNATASRVE